MEPPRLGKRRAGGRRDPSGICRETLTVDERHPVTQRRDTLGAKEIRVTCAEDPNVGGRDERKQGGGLPGPCGIRHPQRERELHVGRLSGRRLHGEVGILVSVDEQETDSVPSRGRREAPEQQGAIAADDQREVPVMEDRRDRISNTGDERIEAVRIDDVGPRFTCRRRIGQRDVPVVVYLRVPMEGIDQTLVPQHEWGTCDSVDPARRVRRHTEQTDRAHPVRNYRVEHLFDEERLRDAGPC
jgi:hypothetical protein